MTPKDISDLLAENGVDTNLWSGRNARIERLQREIHLGEIVLTPLSTGGMQFSAESVVVHVMYLGFTLAHESSLTSPVICTRVKATEKHPTVARRSLGMFGFHHPESLGLEFSKRKIAGSVMYPDLSLFLTVHSYRAVLAPRDYRPQGYIHDRRTYIWRTA